MKETKRNLLAELHQKVTESSELDFLKYMVDCCENVLENEGIMSEVGITPVTMQLLKLRSEVSMRLETLYGIKYGKYANHKHLLAR